MHTAICLNNLKDTQGIVNPMRCFIDISLPFNFILYSLLTRANLKQQIWLVVNACWPRFREKEHEARNFRHQGTVAQPASERRDEVKVVLGRGLKDTRSNCHAPTWSLAKATDSQGCIETLHFLYN